MSERVDWIDYAKGLCIIMVVMMHSTNGVHHHADASSWLAGFIEFAKPFRMPDFFLICGLFLARVIDRDWRTYLDRKVVHFLYFYLLWTAIQIAFKSGPILEAGGPVAVLTAFLRTAWAPLGTLWFLYMIAVFFVVAKLFRRAPHVLFGIALGLHVSLPQIEAILAPLGPDGAMLAEFANRLVFFVIGWLAAPQVFRFAQWVGAWPAAALGGLSLWAMANGTLVATGWAATPWVAFPLGLMGAGAVIAIARLLAARGWLGIVRHAGEHSLAIYLAFFLPMVVTRTVLLKTGVISDLGTVALIVTALAVAVPLLLHAGVSHLRVGRFLFERPAWARIDGAGRRSVADVRAA